MAELLNPTTDEARALVKLPITSLDDDDILSYDLATDSWLSQKLVNANVDASAAIAYSKLNLTTSIVNGDLAGGVYAAITGLGAQSQALNMNGQNIESAELPTDTVNFVDAADETKLLAFGLAAITASTTRTLTMPDANVDLGGLTNSNLASGVFANITGIGAQSQNLDMNTNKIENLVDPTANQEAATKKYVDDQVATANELSELTDVTITSRAANEVLVVNGGNTAWVNALLLNANIDASAAIALSKLEALTSAEIIVGSVSNIPTAVAVTGDIGISNAGVTSITAGAIVNADVNASAAIAYSKLDLSGNIVNADISGSAAIAFDKLATLTSANILVGNVSNVATSVAVTGDIGISNTGVTSISSGVIVDADVNASAAIAFSKLASLTSANILVGSAGNVATSVAVTGDVLISNAGVTSIGAGVIVDADVNASAAIAYSKLNLTGAIVNADINASAAIVYSKLDLSDSIVNADINSSAAIAWTKINTSGSSISDLGDVAAMTEVTGDLLYFTSGAWDRLAMGTANQQIRVNAGGTALEYFTPSAGGTTFDDSTFRIFDNGDNTKEIAFEASAITTSTTRTITMVDRNIDLSKISVQPVAIACTDESTAISTTGTKTTFRVPFAMTVTEVRASLTGACTTGTFTVDINEGGTTILSTKITIDATEKTSTTATTPPVISDSSLADDAEMTVDVDDEGDGTATGLKIYLIGYLT